MSNSRGDFFAVDRRTWAYVCSLGLNQAVAYLVLACFSARDNRTTEASVHAVEKYTSVSRGRAKAAIDKLVVSGAARRLREGVAPRYDLTPAAELPGVVTIPTEPKRIERESIVAFESRKLEWREQVAVVRSLDPIWLPNALVTGAKDEAPPVERARQTQDVMTLRLLVDLYSVQDLREDGGVNRRLMWQVFMRVLVGQQGEFQVWGFKMEKQFVAWHSAVTTCHRRAELTVEEKDAGKNTACDFFHRRKQLVAAGLVEWVPTLFESDADEAEVLHPYGTGGGESLEDRLGAAAHQAGQALLTHKQVIWAETQELSLVPIPRHIANVQMIGIARLRYRPRTSKTAAWWAELNEKGQQVLERYLDIARRPESIAGAA